MGVFPCFTNIMFYMALKNRQKIAPDFEPEISATRPEASEGATGGKTLGLTWFNYC